MPENANKAGIMKKQHLPSKVCTVCNRPFNWRKKWKHVWQEVKYCSQRCRSNKNNTHDQVTHVE
ncbi:DUF2256 domain-containing protein [Marinicella sp. W31]|uniref:DUF2256 domain-containing protein n=1 Tax=Marinicella sp. W31 TaxID=3023713 RepID=UPI003757D4D3